MIYPRRVLANATLDSPPLQGGLWRFRARPSFQISFVIEGDRIAWAVHGLDLQNVIPFPAEGEPSAGKAVLIDVGAALHAAWLRHEENPFDPDSSRFFRRVHRTWVPDALAKKLAGVAEASQKRGEFENRVLFRLRAALLLMAEQGQTRPSVDIRKEVGIPENAYPRILRALESEGFLVTQTSAYQPTKNGLPRMVVLTRVLEVPKPKGTAP